MLTPIYRYLNMTAAMMFFCAALVAGLKAAGVISTTPDVRDVWNAALFAAAGLAFFLLCRRIRLFLLKPFRTLWYLFTAFMTLCYAFSWHETLTGYNHAWLESLMGVDLAMSGFEMGASFLQVVLALAGCRLYARLR